jgi:hypothetical protein
MQDRKIIRNSSFMMYLVFFNSPDMDMPRVVWIAMLKVDDD